MAKSVLIVEDDPDILDVFKQIVESTGFDVKVADSGERAFEMLSNGHFDAMVLDIMLPRVDGFEVARRVKADPKTSNIVIIAVTALDIPNILEKCKAAGAAELLLKPFEPKALINLLHKYIG